MLNSDMTPASDSRTNRERRVMIGSGPIQLAGTLSFPVGARALVVFAFDRVANEGYAPGDLDAVAEVTRRAGLATLAVNLLRPEDEELNKATGFFRENVSVLHQRVSGITNWLIGHDDLCNLPVGYFCVGVSAAAALAAAATRPDAIRAVVAVEPRIDLVSSYLPRLVAGTLLIAAERNIVAQDMIRQSLAKIATETTLDIVMEARRRGPIYTFETIPDVTTVFENAQSIQKVQELATWWFTTYL